MEGYSQKLNCIKYFIVYLKNGEHAWKNYNPFNDSASAFLGIELLYDIYGEIITKLNKKDIRKLRNYNN